MVISLPFIVVELVISISDMHTRYKQYMTMINSIEMHALVDVTAYTIAGKKFTWGNT